MNKIISVIALVLVICLGAYVLYDNLLAGGGEEEVAMSKVEMLDKAKQATVMIINVPNTKRKEYYSGGSGAIITSDGYIVTNHHVTDDAQELYVILNDHSIYPAELIGDFEEADLALIKIEREEPLPFFEFNTQAHIPGQNVYAIGSPFFLEQSISAGILSALKRYNPQKTMTYFVQSNLACNPGNSGGPVVNKDGKLMGIVSWGFGTQVNEYESAPNPSLCFSIPDRVVQYVANEIMAEHKLGEKWLGANYKNVDYITSLESGFNKVVGVQIRFIHKDTPASEVGLKKEDIIIEYNGEEINSVHELNAEVNLVPENTPVKATIWRKNEIMEMEIASEKMFDDDDEASAEDKQDEAVVEDDADTDDDEDEDDASEEENATAAED